MSDKAQLYRGNSVDIFLKIRAILEEHGIRYDTQSRLDGGILKLVGSLFTLGRPSVGLPEDHRQSYFIYVDQEDYEKAKRAVGYIN